MSRSSADILAPARTELARGRPRAALKELEAARLELRTAGDVPGLSEALELARETPTLAPVDTRSRERLVANIEQDMAALSPGGAEAAPAKEQPVAEADRQFVSRAALFDAPVLASAYAQIGRGETGRALRSLEKARRSLLDRSSVAGLGELLEMAQRMSITKPRHEKARRDLIDAAQQNVRFLGRRRALEAGEAWSDPFAAGSPKTASKLPSLPPMTRREILVAACIVVAAAGVITAWALANRAPQRVAHAIKCPTGQEGSPTWSPDGKQIAYAGNGSCGTQIIVIPAKGGPKRELTKGFGELPDWSPDGRTILFRSSDAFSLVAVKGGKQRLVLSDDGILGAAWSPNGKRIAFVHGLSPDSSIDGKFSSTMYTMKPNGSDVRRLLGHSCNPGTPSWSPDGGRLAFSCKDGVYVMRLASRHLIRVESGDYSKSVASTSWSPDSRQVAIASGVIEIANADEGGIARYLYEWNAVTDVAWSPDGRQLAFAITDWGPRINGLYVIDRDGSHRRRLVKF